MTWMMRQRISSKFTADAKLEGMADTPDGCAALGGVTAGWVR